MTTSTGQKIKAAREAQGLDQVELAEKAFGKASHQSLISRWEADLIEPSLSSLRRLAPILHLALGDFTDVSSGMEATA